MDQVGPNPPIGGAPALTNYVACYNDTETPIDVKNNGVFFLNSHIRYEDIEDGSSHTIFFGEKLTNGGEFGWASGTNATLRNAGGINTRLFPTGTTSLPPQPVGDGNPPPPAPVLSPPIGSFSSRHSGGANFGFGDGSVKFLKSTIKPQVFQSLANRADGQLISADSY